MWAQGFFIVPCIMKPTQVLDIEESKSRLGLAREIQVAHTLKVSSIGSNGNLFISGSCRYYVSGI